MYEENGQKDLLLSRIGHIAEEAAKAIPTSVGISLLAELQEDIRADYTSIVVVGEFKHGKSTFINALLGKRIMPANVTPTTATINAVFAGTDERVEILRNDGTMESHPLASGILDQYVASASFNPDDIQYLRIFCDSPFLNARTVLVDTPGVGDLNEHRAEVTYRFVPRADVLIFMLDMTAPLHKSEQEFLEKQLLNKGSDHILYLANFADRVDEDEAQDALQLLERRLYKITGRPARVLSLSAKEALLAKTRGDEELLQLSGLPAALAAIAELAATSAKADAKHGLYLKRYENIRQRLQLEAEAAVELAVQETDVLKNELAGIEAFLTRRASWEGQISAYLQEQEEEISYMAVKSFDYFALRLREDISQRILLFQGGDIKTLAESQLPLQIRLQFSQWVDQYGEAMHGLLYRLEQQVEQGLLQVFQQSVNIRAYREERMELDTEGTIYTERKTSASVKAGLLVGGLGTATLVLGGPFLIPIIGMAGLPFISQKLNQRQLESGKPELLAAANLHLDELYHKARSQLRSYVHQSVETIGKQTLREFTRLLEGTKAAIDNEIAAKQQSAMNQQSRCRELRMFIELIAEPPNLILEGKD